MLFVLFIDILMFGCGYDTFICIHNIFMQNIVMQYKFYRLFYKLCTHTASCVCFVAFCNNLLSFQMTSQRNLMENEIENILLDSADEDDLILGEESEGETDEIIKDFRSTDDIRI